MSDQIIIDLEESYRIANEYIKGIGEAFVKEAFEWLDEETWIRKCERYLKDDR